MADVLVLYYSLHGNVAGMARSVARGIEEVDTMQARVRTVPKVSTVCEASEDSVPAEGPPYVTREDLDECAALALGSPTRFGNMAAALKYFIDTTGSEWMSGTLSGKPAGVFTSSNSLHGGQESTLLTMAVPLLNHGMLLVSVPYSVAELSTTTTGGSPYGATHVTWNRNPDPLSGEEKTVARALGQRVAEVAFKLLPEED